MSHSTVGVKSLCFLLFVITLVSPIIAAVDEPIADINDDGIVNIGDISFLGTLFGLKAGEPNYRDGLDLVPDGEINMDDINALIPFFNSIAGNPGDEDTVVFGKVQDGQSVALPGVTVEIGSGGNCSDVTAEDGTYVIEVPANMTGDTTISFIGADADDPSTGGSGEYPTIPNKPIFVNGGVDNGFRLVSLPERDLTGAVDLTQMDATDNGNGNFTLNEDVEYENSGVTMSIPAGCEATFPDGEAPVLSTTSVNPALLPIPMPPGLSSSIFVTFQPGGTEISCPTDPSTEICVTFDNDDGFVNATDSPVDLDHPDQPFLSGVVDGVFVKLAAATVVDDDGNPTPAGETGSKLFAKVPLPFDFAWYHVDVPLDPCERTTVTGRVKFIDLQGNLVPVENANVSVSGVPNVTTNANGEFTIFNVPAGPNGPNCFTVPFGIKATAIGLVEGTVTQGDSSVFAAQSGGITNLGDICLPAAGFIPPSDDCAEAPPGAENLPNGGFEAGNFTNFSTTGNTNVIGNLGPVVPPDGSFMAFASTGSGAVGGTTSTIETDSFTVPAGVTKLVFCFNFLSNEVPGFVGTGFNDTLRATLETQSGPSTQLILATVNSSIYFDATGTGFNAQTGFLRAEFDVSAEAGSGAPCSLTLEFNVADLGDSVVDSAALLDSLRFE